MDSFVLQSLIADAQVVWQVHNCRLQSCSAVYDAPLLFLLQYDTLDPKVKAQYPLTPELLQQINQSGSTTEIASFMGIDSQLFKKAWHIKYTGRVVIFNELLQLALRFYFSNTAKKAQTVYLPNKHEALTQECENFYAFGVVDVLYKGIKPLVSVADDTISINAVPNYEALPGLHSVMTTDALNKQIQLGAQPFIQSLKTHVTTSVLAQFDDV